MSGLYPSCLAERMCAEMLACISSEYVVSSLPVPFCTVRGWREPTYFYLSLQRPPWARDCECLVRSPLLLVSFVVFGRSTPSCSFFTVSWRQKCKLAGVSWEINTHRAFCPEPDLQWVSNSDWGHFHFCEDNIISCFLHIWEFWP